jgi:hypothetical protein
MFRPPLALASDRWLRAKRPCRPLHVGLCSVVLAAPGLSALGPASPEPTLPAARIVGEDPPGPEPVLSSAWLGLAGQQSTGSAANAAQGGGPLGIDRSGGLVSVGGARSSASDGDVAGWFGGAPVAEGVRLAGLLRLIGRIGSGDPFGLPSGPALESPDAFIWGVARHGAFDLRIEVKGSTLGDDDPQVVFGQLVADVWLDERHTLSFGRVTSPFSSAANLREDRLMFPERTKWSQEFDVDDLGVVGRGRYGFMDLWVGVQNSPDGVGTSFRATGRADFWLKGTQARPTELLYRAPFEEIVRMSLAYTDNGELDEAESYAVELEWRTRDWRIQAEIADNGGDAGDNQPFSLTVQHAVLRNDTEVALRLEDRDDEFDTQAISVGATRYVLRDFVLAQASVDYVTANANDREGWVVRAGFVLGF